MATVIDSLVVLLGLDASNYKKGREQAEKETSETARKAQVNADAITKSLTEVGKTVASLFLGFESVSGFSKFLGGLNKGEADLGRTAAVLGITSHELNKYGLAARYAGQDAASVAASFKTLTDAAVKFQSGQGTSPILDLMRQAQVSVFDTNGHLRNQGEIYEELARKTASWGSQIQASRFAAAGIDAGEIKFLIQSNALRADQYRLAEQNNKVDEDSVKKAQELQEYWRNIGVQIEAAGQKILLSITPAVKDAFTEVSKLMAAFRDTGGIDRIGQVFRAIWSIVKVITDSIKFWASAVNDSIIGKYFNFMFKLYGKGLDLIAPRAKEDNTPLGPPVPTVGPDGEVSYRNNNPGNLRPYAAGQPVDSRGIRTFPNTAAGLKALNDDITAKMHRGLDTIAKIINVYAPAGDHNDVPAYIQDLVKQIGKGADQKLTDADHDAIVAGIIRHEGARLQAGPTPGATARAGAVSKTTVDIGVMHVNSSSADPRAVAAEVPAAIQRKMDIAQAAAGQS